jgi:hypothetical protein
MTIDIGWAIFIHHHSRKLVRKYSLCTLWDISYQEDVYIHFTEDGRIEGKKSNKESNKNLTIRKSRGSQRASRFIDVSNGESNFSMEEEQKQEETPAPQSKLQLEESKIVKEKNERSLMRNEKRIHIDTRVGAKAPKDHSTVLEFCQGSTEFCQGSTEFYRGITEFCRVFFPR